MAYSLPFGRDVNQLIGRYAVGYPSDRIREMMAHVERNEYQVLDESIDETFVWKFVKWSEFFGPWRNCEIVHVRKLLAKEFLTEDNAASDSTDSEMESESDQESDTVRVARTSFCEVCDNYWDERNVVWYDRPFAHEGRNLYSACYKCRLQLGQQL